jgi:PhzF family phenazine biosynthesis protein
MLHRPYQEIDVFTSQVYAGNPLAVVVDGSCLDTAQMQRFASWTNLSETTFLLEPTDRGADYRVRIFTPSRELPFAGHPTLGSCHAWLATGGRPRRDDVIVQQCGAGLVQLRHDGSRLAFAAPAMRVQPVESGHLDLVLAALGLTHAQLREARWLDNGPRWLGLLLDNARTVLSVEPDHTALKSLGLVGIIGPHAREGDAPGDYEVRAFAASDGIPEDPVTGSLNAALAQWLVPAQLAPARYVACQGARLGRAGRVHVDTVEGTTWIGGECVTCVEGTVRL